MLPRVLQYRAFLCPRKDNAMAYKVKKSITLGHDFQGTPIRKYFYGKTNKEVNRKIDQFKLELTRSPDEERSDIPFIT